MLPLDLPANADRDTRTLHERLSAVEGRIDAACARAGRSRDEVHLLPVTKTVPAERLARLHALGYRQVGENRVQEASEKAEALAHLDFAWCVIGPLQTNKARHVARFAHELHTLHNVRVAQELDRRLQREGRRMRVLIQVNTSGEASKSGVAPEEVMGFLRELPACDALDVAGFMTMARASSDEAVVRACFRRLHSIREQAREEAPGGFSSLDELSMGMSGDFEWAVEEGATLVRVGTAIFGERPST